MKKRYDQAGLSIFSDCHIHTFNVKDQEFSNFQLLYS